MRCGKLLALLPLCGLVAACAPQQKYYWGNYSESLYSYYGDPSKEADYEKALFEVTSGADQGGRKVPPGLYAEYGYEELSRGHADKAIEMYQREEQAWPESTVFMDRAITAAKAGQKSPPAPASSGAAPAASSPSS